MSMHNTRALAVYFKFPSSYHRLAGSKCRNNVITLELRKRVCINLEAIEMFFSVKVECFSILVILLTAVFRPTFTAIITTAARYELYAFDIAKTINREKHTIKRDSAYAPVFLKYLVVVVV